MRQVRELGNCCHSWQGSDSFEQGSEAIAPSASEAQAKHRGAAARTKGGFDDEGCAANRSRLWPFVAEDVPFEELHEVEEQVD